MVRLGAAFSLPLAVPAIITGVIWALPGDPASIICPPGICSGADVLAERWNLDSGPVHFFLGWLSSASRGDFGRSWRLVTGAEVAPMLIEAVPNTALLVGLAFTLLLLGALGAATRTIPARVDAIFQFVGLVPMVVLAMCVTAGVTLHFGADAFSDEADRVKLLLGALALGVADAALSGTLTGIRTQIEGERQRRYVEIGLLRGEGELANALPNALPALVGQMRARTLHLLSGAVVVEVILQIDGLGDLLWSGTLVQDFGVVLAATFGFSLISSMLLIVQALVETAVALYQRRSPAGVLL